MLNQCTFIGHLGADPDIRSTQSGDKIANLSIGVTEKWKDRDGNRQERTEWVRASVFGGLVKVCESYLKKGSKVYIQGKMQTRKWQDQNGNDKYSTEIILSGFDAKLVMLDGPNTGDGGGSAGGYGGGYGGGGRDYTSDLDDEIPF